MFSFPQQMKRVFKNPSTQSEFEKNGFMVIPFYTADEITFLENLYKKLHPKNEKGFFPSTFSKDLNYRQTTDTEIRRIGMRSINQHLQDVKVVCGSFIVKSPGEESEMCLHQDMTLVDESEFTGINIWCPLVNLTTSNGVLYILPESHRLFPTYRGSSIPGIYDVHGDEIKKYMTPLFLKAGEAVVFDQSILHFSPPNLSESIRIVTNIYFSHNDVRFRTAYCDKQNNPEKIELFEQDESFMTNFEQFGDNIFDRPKIGNSIGLFDYNFPQITPELLAQKYGAKKPKNKSLWTKLKEAFV
jgi:hypothetical protein